MVVGSVIILNWNTSDETIECLKSLENQTNKNFEVVLVDNGSRIAEVEKLKSFFKNKKVSYKIKLIMNKENMGFCEGNNIGIRNSKGDFIVLLNNDTLLDKRWYENLIKPFSDPNVGVTASKIIFYDGKNNNLIQYAGSKLTPYGRPVYFGIGQKDIGQYDNSTEAFFGMGGSFAIRRSVLEKLGEMFPKQYFIYFEEIDICWRIKNINYKILYCPDSVVYHKGSVSLKKAGQIGFKQDRLTFRNKYLTFYRNLPFINFLLILPLMVSYDLLRCIKHLASGRFWFIKAYIYGLKDFMQTKSKIKKPRSGNLYQLEW